MTITREGAFSTRHLFNQGVVDSNVFQGGGAAANCTKVWGGNIASVAYNAATGVYLITFTEVAYQIPSVTFGVYGASADLIATGGAYSASAKTLAMKVWDLSAGALADLATTDYVCIKVNWSDSTVPQ